MNKIPYGFGDATYHAVGGHEGLVKLVNEFYNQMENLPEASAVLAMHPNNLNLSRTKLIHFLSEWMNGPNLYAKHHGSINIPQAHSHLEIGIAERDAWLRCMQIALEKQHYPKELTVYLLQQFSKPAEAIRQFSQKTQ